MSKKLEKLKEVNNILKRVLEKLEFEMFIENINDVKDNIINNNKPKIIVNPKQ